VHVSSTWPEIRRRPDALGRLSAVSDMPELQYASTADGLHIAFQVLGDGPPDLLLELGAGGYIDLVWEIRSFARILRGLASFRRLILFDQRGSGLSDPLARWEEPSLEDRAREILEVLDAAGSDRAAWWPTRPVG
jgi:pimeloyl-ACP methyl ester carboxylesterase